MNNDKKKWFQKLVNLEPLHVMQTASILWVALLILFVLTTSKCPWRWDVPLYRLDLQYFSCRSINELGDFLAGAFAPLAFLWLAGAVFIQARELAEQRKSLDAQLDELELTRREMKQQRDVLQAQANEAKASTKFISEQTDILKREQVLREQVSADLEIEEQLLNIIEWQGEHKKINLFIRLLKFENEYKDSNILSRIKDKKIEIKAGPFAYWKRFEIADFDYIGEVDHEKLLKNFAPTVTDLNDLVSNLKFDFIICSYDAKLGYYSDSKKKFIDLDLSPLKIAIERIDILTLKASEKQIVRLNRLRIIMQYQSWLLIITKINTFILKQQYEHCKAISDIN
jgi:hypothetical protein